MTPYYLVSRTIFYSIFVITLYFFYATVYLDPCERTLSYSIGTISPESAIPHWRLEEILWNAEDVWEDVSGFQLFRYDKTGGAMTINIQIDESPQSATPGTSFEKGSNYRDEITINHFQNQHDLSLVLAHEFGHSLDLDHVPGNASVMNALLPQGVVLPLHATSFDIIEFNKQCRKL